MKVKIGIGYDIHRLVKERKLVIGCVEIPYSLGLVGHSDADVLAHAIADSIFGALGLPDIGQQFQRYRFKDNSTACRLSSRTAWL